MLLVMMNTRRAARSVPFFVIFFCFFLIMATSRDRAGEISSAIWFFEAPLELPAKSKSGRVRRRAQEMCFTQL
jgi:hypothetical protein